jgi:hypothetical protein
MKNDARTTRKASSTYRQPVQRGDGSTCFSERAWRDVPTADYSAVRSEIRDGDCLLYLPCLRWYWPLDLWTLLIRISACPARGEVLKRAGVVHAAMAGWWGSNLMRVQMATSSDRVSRLSEEVSRWPGKILVSRPVSLRSRAGAVCDMVSSCQRAYGFRALLLVALYRHLVPHVRRARRVDGTPFCSMAYKQALAGKGADPRPDLPDWCCEPADLFDSSYLEPLWRLT